MITGGSINQNKVNWLTVEDEYKTSKEEFDKLAKQIATEQEILRELEVKKEALAIVTDDNLSLAIGKKGSNIRLASKLTKYKLEIKTLSQINEEGNK